MSLSVFQMLTGGIVLFSINTLIGGRLTIYEAIIMAGVFAILSHLNKETSNV